MYIACWKYTGQIIDLLYCNVWYYKLCFYRTTNKLINIDSYVANNLYKQSLYFSFVLICMQLVKLKNIHKYESRGLLALGILAHDSRLDFKSYK